MNKSILLVIVVIFTVLVYVIFRYFVGWDQNKSLIVTGAAFLAMVIPEVIGMIRGKRNEEI